MEKNNDGGSKEAERKIRVVDFMGAENRAARVRTQREGFEMISLNCGGKGGGVISGAENSRSESLIRFLHR